jgi:DNA topoisomerase-3
MAEMRGYASEIVERARSFEYHELYGSDPPVGTCPFGGRDVVEQAWFYTCRRDPGLPEDAKANPGCKNANCPLLLWKDVSGRYLDRASAAKLLEHGRTGTLDGFLARSGRLYRGHLELEPDTGAVKIRSEGYDEGSASDQPTYEVNPEPLGRCPFGEECSVVESPTQFVCERKLKEAELSREERARAAAEGAPQSCGFVLPRTVCKREITRDEALHYVAEGKTELLTDFTSRFGRPFSATLVLKENGRHGFEFPPRKAKGAAAAEGGEAPAAAAGTDATARRPRGRGARGRSSPAARSPKVPKKKKAAAKAAPAPVEATPAAKPRTLLRRKKAGSAGDKAPGSAGDA